MFTNLNAHLHRIHDEVYQTIHETEGKAKDFFWSKKVEGKTKHRIKTKIIT